MVDVLLRLDEIQEEPNLGPDTNSFYISTDLANQYLIQLIREKNQENPFLSLAMTEGIILSETSKTNIQEVCALIVDKYKELIQDYKAKGIYTVINVAPSLKAPAHQNWMYYDVINRQIIRFEPNGPNFDRIMGDQYPFRALMKCISSQLKVSWVQSDNVKINPFNGCRATSTILVLMYILGLDYETLSSRSDAFLRTLAIQLSDNIKNQYCNLPPLPRKSRRSAKIATYVEPPTFTKDEMLIYSNQPESNENIQESPLKKENTKDQDFFVKQSDRIIDVLDLENKTNYELRKYLREHNIQHGSRTSRENLIKKVMAHQNTLIFT
jgi:hypothetical protein